mgnify:FL=1
MMDVKSIPWENLVTGDKKEMIDLGRDMLSSWANKSGEQSNAAWLAGEMSRHIGMEAEAARAFGDEVAEGIDDFNATLDAVDRACQHGGTKEAWLAKQVKALPMDMEERGRYLMEVRDGLQAGNAAAYRTIETGELVPEIPMPEVEMTGGWTQAQINDYAREIGQQAALSGAMGGAMDIVRPDVPMSLPVEIEGAEDNMRGTAIDVGLKTVAVGVLKVAAEKGKLPGMFKATPVAALPVIAGSAMENFRIAGQLVNNQLSTTQAVERLGRVNCAAVGNLAGHLLSSALIARIPYVGPIAAFVLTTPIGAQIQSKVSQTVSATFYEGFDKLRPVAVKTVETIMEQSRSMIETVKNFAKNMVTA